MVRVYVVAVSPFFDLRGFWLLDEERRARVLAYANVEDRARCLLAGLLLRRFVDGKLSYGKNGKPYLARGGLHFNISHSGDYVVLATAESEIGIDIEKIAPYSAPVAERCFTPEEQLWLELQNNDEAFYRLWCAKESVMKALGTGFSMNPRSFSVLPQCMVAGQPWHLEWLLHEGHMICIARADKDECIEIFDISKEFSYNLCGKTNTHTVYTHGAFLNRVKGVNSLVGCGDVPHDLDLTVEDLTMEVKKWQ